MRLACVCIRSCVASRKVAPSELSCCPMSCCERWQFEAFWKNVVGSGYNVDDLKEEVNQTPCFVWRPMLIVVAVRDVLHRVSGERDA